MKAQFDCFNNRLAINSTESHNDIEQFAARHTNVMNRNVTKKLYRTDNKARRLQVKPYQDIV